MSTPSPHEASRPDAPESPRARRLHVGAAGAIATLTIAALLADVAPPEGCWGFVGRLALPWPLRSLGAALVLLLLLPGLSTRASALVEGAVARVAAFPVPAAVWIGAAMALAWLLRSQVLYGDGPQTIQLIPEGDWINRKEPLDRLLTWSTWRATSAWLGWGARRAVALVSVLAGGLYLAAAARWFRRLEPTGARAWALLTLLTAGYVPLFFGHVENYSLLAAGTLWMLTLAWEAVRDPGRPLWPFALAAGLTFATHLSTAWLFGAPLVVLVSRLRDRGRTPWRELLIAVAVGLVPVAVAAALVLARFSSLSGVTLTHFGGGDGSLFVPLFETSSVFERYTLFAPAHLWDVLNELLLVAPAALACLPLLLLQPRGREAWLLAAATAGVLAYAFLFNADMWIANPAFGALNEWDLFSVAGVPLTAWLALCLARLRPPRGLDVRAAALAFALLHVVSFTLFNARLG
jgi:hypothetical protein